MKTIAGIVVLCMTVCLSFAQTALCQELTLVDQGESTYRIVVAVDASIQDYYAAQQLQQYVEEMSGVKLRIVGDDNALSETEIIVGFNRHMDRLGLDLEKDSFGPEEFLIKTVGQTLVIIGGSPRGVLYGVNSLLTDEWGCRWFTPLLKRIPRHERLTLPPIERRYQPPFEWRDVYFWSGLDNEWAFHNFLNKDFAKLRPEQGGWTGFSHRYYVHTSLLLVPPEQYLKDHPDYFWTGEGDQPRSGRTTTLGRKGWIGLCLTNPEVANIAAQSLLEMHRQEPEGDVYYAISHMDYDDWCECPRCRAWHEAKLGHPLPANAHEWPHGALWLDFADRVQKLFEGEPDAPKVSVLAYGYTPTPPAKPVMHKDLNVIYAESNNLCQMHAIDDPTCWRNQIFHTNLAGWLKSAGSVYVWLYKVNFDWWCWVHPNMHTFAADLRYLRNVGVKGIFAQGNQMGWGGQRFAGEMNELRAYLLARLMWNPDLDWRQERREFCAAYYGAAAGAVIEEYLDDVREAFVEQGVHSYSAFNPEDFQWITPRMIARWYAYMDNAESLAKDDEHKKLVRIARLAVQFTEANIEQDPTERQVLLQAYLDTARELGAAYFVGEGISLRAWAEQMKLQWK